MQTETFDHPLPGLSTPVRLVHLTDLHVGRNLRTHTAAIAAANDAAPDLVVLTGDYVGYGLASVPRLQELLSRLRAPTYAVLGNHDHWAGGVVIADALRAAGVWVLQNACAQHGELTLVGIDDPVTANDDVPRATATVRGPALALVHHPRAAPAIWAAGVPVVLSGHTHGGHVDLGPLTDRFHRFVAGRYHDGDNLLYVNPGIGGALVARRVGRRSRPTVACINLVPAWAAPFFAP